MFHVHCWRVTLIPTSRRSFRSRLERKTSRIAGFGHRSWHAPNSPKPSERKGKGEFDFFSASDMQLASQPRAEPTMSEIPMAKKKLPFKPTALRKNATRVDASADNDKPKYADDLELFRRSKEMLPIMEADRERRLVKKQKQEEERRRAAATAGKRPWEGEEDDDDESTNETFRSTTPVNVDLGSFGEEARWVFFFFSFFFFYDSRL